MSAGEYNAKRERRRHEKRALKAHIRATRLRKVRGKKGNGTKGKNKGNWKHGQKKSRATAKLGNENGPVGKKVNDS